MHIPERPFGDAHLGNRDGELLRYFHVEVRNNHRSKVALNCCVFLESIQHEQTQKRVDVQTIEFKWAGSVLPNVFIAPQSSRRFDAFKVSFDDPSQIQFNLLFCDSTEYFPRVPGLGGYLFTYGVYCSNFSSVHQTFRLKATGALETTSFSLV